MSPRAASLSLSLSLLLSGLAAGAAAGGPAPGDWPAYGHDAGGARFSPLTDINRSNVAKLAVAWTFRTGHLGIETWNDPRFETTPIVVEGRSTSPRRSAS